MTRRLKRELIRLCIAAILFVAAFFLPLTGVWRLLGFLPAYFTAGYDVWWKAIRNILHGQVFDESFLMVVASGGAFLLGDGPEAAAVMLFYQLGEFFQRYAVGRSRRSIAALMEIRPDTANLETENGIETVDPSEVPVGSVIVIRSGDRVPLDGVVLSGHSDLDTSALTGESVPRPVQEDDEIISGCINGGGLLRVRVTRPFAESTVSRLLEMVEQASEKKARTEQFITRFARVYTPCVVGAAVLLALIPSLLVGNTTQWIHRALTFLVISCPCALVISVPLGFFGGIGGASKQGILIKGGNYIEALSRADTVVFDKTGTLTEGIFAVAAVHGTDDLLALAASAESGSTHPISRSLLAACPDPVKPDEVEEMAGRGVRAVIGGRVIYAGNETLMREIGVESRPCHRTGTIVHLAEDGRYLGHIVISDSVKPDAENAIAALKALGIRKTVMLTGDRDAVGKEVAGKLGIDEVYTELLPADKVNRVEQLLGQKPKGASLLFVGDGINDAPVLARADVGIAMGGMGSDAAIEAADVTLMNDRPSSVATAVRLARRTMRIVKQNIWFSLIAKAAVLLLGAFGIASMWAAVFADVGVAVIAICNSMRALSFFGTHL